MLHEGIDGRAGVFLAAVLVSVGDDGHDDRVVLVIPQFLFQAGERAAHGIVQRGGRSWHVGVGGEPLRLRRISIPIDILDPVAVKENKSYKLLLGS